MLIYILKMEFTLEADKAIPNTIEMKIKGETHTLGNLVVETMLQDKRCTFAAYDVPHPLEDQCTIRIGAEKNIPVRKLAIDNLKNLCRQIEDLIEQTKLHETK
ncbi:DNA-directed RNA polymerase subunit L [Astathelohania contejeani]|uniref:DNA-directed RNA polymerase subunit L n=1 Tax=Astathelohania contejeani TaxID=164912 RepID=A0ABQ7HV42_9MICR|nr:DNA-directed RNA polymerase subunit L [Thelohania contejeani]